MGNRIYNKCGGLTKHPTYINWRCMRYRCYDTKHSHYKNYGGKGIKICTEWLISFVSFYNWAIKNGWSIGLTVDRIDNSKDYMPENCRWVTKKQQANNMTTNVKYFYNNKYINLIEIATLSGLSSHTIGKRIKRGWSEEDAVTIPLHKSGRKKSSNNRQKQLDLKTKNKQQ